MSDGVVATLRNHYIISRSDLQIGKVDEIFGGVSNSYFTIKMSDGVVALLRNRYTTRCVGLQIGKVDEIFGGVSNSYFTIKMSDGVVATSYAAGDLFYIDPMKLLPLERFLPQPKGAGGRGAGGRGTPSSNSFLKI